MAGMVDIVGAGETAAGEAAAASPAAAEAETIGAAIALAAAAGAAGATAASGVDPSMARNGVSSRCEARNSARVTVSAPC